MAFAAQLRQQIEATLANRQHARSAPIRLDFAPRLVAPGSDTGYQTLDQLLRGGLPIAGTTEIIGTRSSGRTSIARRLPRRANPRRPRLCLDRCRRRPQPGGFARRWTRSRPRPLGALLRVHRDPRTCHDASRADRPCASATGQGQADRHPGQARSAPPIIQPETARSGPPAQQTGHSPTTACRSRPTGCLHAGAAWCCSLNPRQPPRR